MFDAVSTPPIGIMDYVQRLMQISQSHPVHLVTSLILIDKLLKAQSSETYSKVRMSKFSVHRIVALSIMLSTKLLEDHYFANKYWAKIMGMTL